MELKTVIVCAILGMCFSITNAIELKQSNERATAGHNFTFICVIKTNDFVRFSMNGRSLCTIIGGETDGTCTFDGAYNKTFTYDCDLVDKTYKVHIPGSIVEQFHNSTWVCEILYQRDLQIRTLFVQVPVTSVILIPNDTDLINVQENVAQQFVCKTNPIRPTGNIQWHVDGQNVTFASVRQVDTCITDCNDDKVITSSLLMYTWKRNDSGKSVYCTATNIDEFPLVKSTQKTINVQYGPSAIILSPSGLSYLVRENESVGTISCLSICNPNCTNKWTGPGLETIRDTLLLTNIYHNQSGQYTCTSENSIGHVEKTIDIRVQYHPTIQNYSISSGDFVVPENTKVTLSCFAEGDPVPNISWYLDNYYQTKVLKEGNDTGHLDLTIISTKCEDSGQYICIANNRIFPPSSQTKFLNVTCAPRQNVSCSSKRVIRTGRNVDTSINVCWISNPIPTVTWTLDLYNSRFRTNTLENMSSVLFKSVFSIRFQYETKFVIKVMAQNSNGITAYKDFEIQVNDTYNQNTQQSSNYDDKQQTVMIAGIFLSTIGTISFIIGLVLFFMSRHRYKERNDTSTSSKNYTGLKSCGKMELKPYDTLHKGDTKTHNEPTESQYEEIKSEKNDQKDKELGRKTEQQNRLVPHT